MFSNIKKRFNDTLKDSNNKRFVLGYGIFFVFLIIFIIIPGNNKDASKDKETIKISKNSFSVVEDKNNYFYTHVINIEDTSTVIIGSYNNGKSLYKKTFSGKESTILNYYGELYIEGEYDYIPYVEDLDALIDIKLLNPLYIEEILDKALLKDGIFTYKDKKIVVNRNNNGKIMDLIIEYDNKKISSIYYDEGKVKKIDVEIDG